MLINHAEESCVILYIYLICNNAALGSFTLKGNFRLLCYYMNYQRKVWSHIRPSGNNSALFEFMISVRDRERIYKNYMCIYVLILNSKLL